MKFIIAVDCDGPACVVGEPGKSLSDSRDMVFAREQATRETDAAARALFNAGAKQVIVWDNHGMGANLVFDKLDSRCEILLGAGFGRRFPQLDESYTGVLMIGYHAMEGTPDGVLAHTYSPWVYKSIQANGCEVGEIAMDASVAGEFGVPLILVSSDDKGCSEASEFIPWAETVITKTGFGRTCARSKHPETVQDEIYRKTLRAVSNLKTMKPFLFNHPVTIEVQYKKFLFLLKALILKKGWLYSPPLGIRTKLNSMIDWRC